MWQKQMFIFSWSWNPGEALVCKFVTKRQFLTDGAEQQGIVSLAAQLRRSLFQQHSLVCVVSSRHKNSAFSFNTSFNCLYTFT